MNIMIIIAVTIIMTYLPNPRSSSSNIFTNRETLFGQAYATALWNFLKTGRYKLCETIDKDSAYNHNALPIRTK